MTDIKITIDGKDYTVEEAYTHLQTNRSGNKLTLTMNELPSDAQSRQIEGDRLQQVEEAKKIYDGLHMYRRGLCLRLKAISFGS